MKLPSDSKISDNKIKEYLLKPKKRNDKSFWLGQAGYERDNWQVLKNDIMNQLLSKDATLVETTEFGQLFKLTGTIIGPNGKSLFVCTIWMKEFSTGLTDKVYYNVSR